MFYITKHEPEGDWMRELLDGVEDDVSAKEIIMKLANGWLSHRLMGKLVYIEKESF